MLGQLPYPSWGSHPSWRVSFSSQGQLNGVMSSLLLSPQCSSNTHRVTLPTDEFKQAVHEARNEANASAFLRFSLQSDLPDGLNCT